MRFPARGAWNAKFHPSYMNGVDVRTDDFVRTRISWMHRKADFRTHDGNFFLTARALIGYFEVTWHQTNETVSRQNFWKGTLLNLCRQRETVHCYPRMLTGSAIHSTKISGNFGLNLNGSVRSNGKVCKKLIHLLRWTTFPGRTSLSFGWMVRAPVLQRGLIYFQITYGKHWDSWETKLTVSLGASHKVFIILRSLQMSVKSVAYMKGLIVHSAGVYGNYFLTWKNQI